MAALKGVKTLDMVGGEITKVAYEGAEYERVEGDAKGGDLVRLSHDAWLDVTPGGFYIVNGAKNIWVHILDDNNDPHKWSNKYYDLFRKKHVRLKVGDYAKVVDSIDYQDLAKDDIVKVLEDDGTPCPFYCEVLRGECAGEYRWMWEPELVLATEDEVAAAKEAEAKRSIEAKWAKIGRKVDEYMKGDVVHFKDDYVAIGVVEDVGADLLGVRMPDEAYQSPYKKNVTLIIPVEARFDRS
ncbi:MULTISPECIES: hypothetical protein [unclassified Bacillus (in: firmicutes)]|uniref:hypothetical protein n=1 Tax=unclassified Bacillus (in: firmicutes) TaxID=185979 RepID=UPI00163C7A42|nr:MULTISPECIES: hypothetical protein [unclassified Bacillus (in: firmicutes)]QNH48708.1 hypothetical protein H7F25_04335 [Bacillus sp. PAMC28571]QNK43003.1 hypothetical protein H7F24_10900 [Bacillus sp. PAMC22265]